MILETTHKTDSRRHWPLSSKFANKEQRILEAIWQGLTEQGWSNIGSIAALDLLPKYMTKCDHLFEEIEMNLSTDPVFVWDANVNLNVLDDEIDAIPIHVPNIY